MFSSLLCTKFRMLPYLVFTCLPKEKEFGTHPTSSLNPRGMMMEMHVCGDISNGLHMPLQRAYDSFKSFCRAHKILTSQKHWAVRQLVRDGYGYYLNCKGFNSRVISEWLLNKLQDVNRHPDQYPDLIQDERAQMCETALMLTKKSIFWAFVPHLPGEGC